MSDLLNMRAMAAAEMRQVDLTTMTTPTIEQFEGWVNDGIKDVIRNLCPRRIDKERWTQGRLDLLTSITETEFVVLTGEAASPIALPSSAASICYYAGVRLGLASALYMARERTLEEVYGRQSGAYAASYTSPIWAWHPSGIMTAPVLYAPFGAEYNYIKLPDLLTSTPPVNEVFPLDNQLMDAVMLYVRVMVWMQKGDVSRMMEYMRKYLGEIARLTGTPSITMPKDQEFGYQGKMI